MSPAQVKSDFVNVRLAAAGLTFAGSNGTVRIANAHMDYKFSGDTAQRVLTSEWSKIFSIEKYNGAPMFELVPTAQAAAPVATQAAPAPVKATAAPVVAIPAPSPIADATKAAASTSQPAAQPVAVATQEK
jgi:hypothetical protein